MVIELQSPTLGTVSSDEERIAAQILASCGLVRTLAIGADQSLLHELRRQSIDVHSIYPKEERAAGIDLSHSARLLPFEEGAFGTVVACRYLESVEATDVPTALKEIFRVTAHSAFLVIATPRTVPASAGEPRRERQWWEQQCFRAGFRKHPAYYVVNEYRALNIDEPPIFIALEKVPANALTLYPLSSLEEERGLHMDMARDTGERSDAHLIRYTWACDYIKPGDRVLDAACGLGYGGNIIRWLTRADSVVGIDSSEYAVNYAQMSYGNPDRPNDYKVGSLPGTMEGYQDGSFDVIISFETLEHLENPVQLLSEFRRLLTPGGRLIVSVPNDWSDESGGDPNPYHLQVYDWGRLKRELGQKFLLETAVAQTASQVKELGQRVRWVRRLRTLTQVAIEKDLPIEAEWWLMTAMKSPLEPQPYYERPFSNIAGLGHSSVDYCVHYEHPWLMHAMVNVSFRLKNPIALTDLAEGVLLSQDVLSNDYAAALCVKAYAILQSHDVSSNKREECLSQIQRVVNSTSTHPMRLRWKVSLLFVKGLLLESAGRLIEAMETFADCSKIDIKGFGIHLATKTTDSFYRAGRISFALESREKAREYWSAGVAYGQHLLSVSIEDILINSKFPNLFNYGDGIREYALAWDNISRCANGLHILHLEGGANAVLLHCCHQTEYATVTRDLLSARHSLSARTAMLERITADVQQRALELGQTRKELVDRTRLLEEANLELERRTQELVGTRSELRERTRLLEGANLELERRTQELVNTRSELRERTRLLEGANLELERRTEELVDTRDELIDRTRMLEQSNLELEFRTKELIDARHALVEQTALLQVQNSGSPDAALDKGRVRHESFLRRLFSKIR